MALLFGVKSFLVLMSISVLPVFIDQRAVFNRERNNSQLNVVSYTAGNFLASLPGLFLIAVVSSVFVTTIAGLQIPLSLFILNLYLTLVVAESFMSLIAILVPVSILGLAVGAAIFGLFMMSEGFIVPRDKIPWFWIWLYHIAFHTYSFKCFVYGEFHDISRSSEDVSSTATAGFLVLERLNMLDVDVPLSLSVLLLYALALQVLLTVILKFFHHGRR